MTTTEYLDLKRLSVAFPTDDGITITQHFGRATGYEVVTIAAGKVAGRERRDKFSHHHGADGHPDDGHDHGSAHGRMIDAITDCQVVVAGGMGRPIFEELARAGIRPILVQTHSIDEALEQILGGTLTNAPERVHAAPHHHQ